MSLVDMKRYLQKSKQVTLSHLCTLFKAEPERVRCMLLHLIKKGKVRKCTRMPACGSKCFKCPAAEVEMYEWIDGTPACI
ncbi:MAG: FeoC-like transcriptional regulator [Gammaproteobacteria bacterium]|nr:FeoC-like transcriptional regulator [Gammaproteobacteria bacterium]